MKGFVDEACIKVSSGNGGSGSVSFRREKYVPKGGPDGGDGGRGGDIIFEVRKNLKTLAHISKNKNYKAEDGESGRSKKRFGKDGAPCVIAVPPGTLIKNRVTDKIIIDLNNYETYTLLKGGIGGKGNVHFKSSVNQAPKYAQKGKPCETLDIKLEINLIADIGFVGFPNAGKSSLLNVLTSANSEVGAYPFTTKIPNLGIFNTNFTQIILADIPGILEGASKGVGLGIKFLKHIARTKALAFLIDITADNFENEFSLLQNELKEFSEELLDKKRVIILTKIDICDDLSRVEKLKKKLSDENIIAISAITNLGLDELKKEFIKLL